MHQVGIFLVVNAWFFTGVANPLQECRFSCIGTTDDEDTKMSILLSSVISVYEVENSHVGGCKRKTTRVKLRCLDVTPACPYLYVNGYSESMPLPRPPHLTCPP